MNRKCSFCNSEISKNRKMIEGFDEVYICESCVKIALDELKKEKYNIDLKEQVLNNYDNIFDSLLEDPEYKEAHNDFLEDLKEEGEVVNDYIEMIVKNMNMYGTLKHLDKKDKEVIYKLVKNNEIFVSLDDTPITTEGLKVLFEGSFEEGKEKNDKLSKANSIKNPLDYYLQEDLEETKPSTISFNPKTMSPSKIKKELDKYVIGQEEAKKILSVAVYNHYKRISTNANIKKGNILMVGPSGSGKTYLLQRLAKVIDAPLLITDATTLTETGYVGASVEDIISDLYTLSNEDIDRTEKAIVYIDEIDKIAKNNGQDNKEKDVGGLGVQEALLKLLEGSDVSIETRKGKVTINTDNILFVCGGAFSDLKETEEKKTSIGFNREVATKEKTISVYKKKITQQDIVSYGFIPEFVGRLPVIAQLSPLDKEDLKDILLNTEDSLISEYEELLSLDDISLSFSEEAVDYIVEESIKKEIGARGLRSVFEQNMYSLMFHAPDTDAKEIIVTKDFLKTNDLDKLKVKNKKKLAKA